MAPEAESRDARDLCHVCDVSVMKRSVEGGGCAVDPIRSDPTNDTADGRTLFPTHVTLFDEGSVPFCSMNV